MQRRSFLTGIIAACAAPAIVKADTLMKLWVPKQPPWYIPAGLLENEPPFLSICSSRDDLVLAELDPFTGGVLREFRGLKLLECQDSEDLERGILRVPSSISFGASLRLSFDYKAFDQVANRRLETCNRRA